MYTKDKTKRITLRLNDEQFDFVRLNADWLGVAPSEFLRMVINSALASYKAGLKAEEGKEKEAFMDNLGQTVETTIRTAERQGEGRENDETYKHHIV